MTGIGEQSYKEVFEMLRLATLEEHLDDSEGIPAELNRIISSPRFPLSKLLDICLPECEKSFLATQRWRDSVVPVSLNLEKVLIMIGSAMAKCRVNSTSLILHDIDTFGIIEVQKTHYHYIAFLVARLWAIKHEPV